jgi:hypothetical protein
MNDKRVSFVELRSSLTNSCNFCLVYEEDNDENEFVLSKYGRRMMIVY